jgi:hypothetical protein
MMAALPENSLERCLRLGFKNHVFVSWPHLIEDRGADIVRELAGALQNKFNNEGGGVVYVDDRLKSGEKWDPALRLNLCRSGVMLAFLVRSYFKSDYCAIEWAIADQLQQQRLPKGTTRGAIIPILLSEKPPLPAQVKTTQCRKDFLPLITFSQLLKSHPQWLVLVSQLAEEIMEILDLVCAQPPDWTAQEELARKAVAMAWDFSVARPSPVLNLPNFVVEERSSAIR